MYTEHRMMSYLLLYMIMFAVITTIFFFSIGRFYSLSNISGFLNHEGKFDGPNLNIDYYSGGVFLTIIQNFLIILSLFWAIFVQWKIESKYNISRELILVTIVWFLCNQTMTICQLFQAQIIYKLGFRGEN